MTEQELVDLEIERRALLETVRQFVIGGCDVRMEVGLNEFLKTLEKRAAEIQDIINREINI